MDHASGAVGRLNRGWGGLVGLKCGHPSHEREEESPVGELIKAAAGCRLQLHRHSIGPRCLRRTAIEALEEEQEEEGPSRADEHGSCERGRSDR